MSYRGIISLMPKTPPFDVDALAFITASGLSDTTQKNAINTLVLDLKANSLWTKMKAIYPFVGGSATTHKFNLKDPRDLDAAYRIVFAGGMLHDANGLITGGLNASADTKISGSTLGTTSLSGWYYSRDDSSDTEAVFGGGNYLWYFPRRISGVSSIALNSNNKTPSAPVNTTGLLGASRIDNTDIIAYRNGVSYASSLGAVTPNSESTTLTIGWLNTIGFYTALRCSFAAFGEGLNGTESSNLYTIVQNYQTILNRQVP